MKKIMLLSIVFFTFFIVSCASSQHISDGGIQQSDSTNTFDKSFEAPCQVYDDDEFFAATGIYKGKASQIGEVQKFAHVNAQDICRMKVKHTYKGMVSDFSKSSGNNRGNNIETKISQAGEQIIDTVINDTKAICVKYSSVDAGGMVEAYVGIRIRKIDLFQTLVDKLDLSNKEKKQLRRTIEIFKKEEKEYLECVENSTKECWEQYLQKFPNNNQEHIEVAKRAIEDAKRALQKEGMDPINKKKRTHAKYIENSGISLLVIGTVIAAGGVAGFFIESEREHDKYKSMSTSAAIENAINNGEDKASYINRADKHRDKSNLYRNLAITSGVVGGAIAITGVTLTIVGIKKRDSAINKHNKSFSFVPVEKGFFASLSFDF